jgi:hypothetical protein
MNIKKLKNVNPMTSTAEYAFTFDATFDATLMLL